MVFYRLRQRKSGLWYPQYKRGDFAEWNNFVGEKGQGWRNFETPIEAQVFLDKKSPKWRQYYEGERMASVGEY